MQFMDYKIASVWQIILNSIHVYSQQVSQKIHSINILWKKVWTFESASSES